MIKTKHKYQGLRCDSQRSKTQGELVHAKTNKYVNVIYIELINISQRKTIREITKCNSNHIKLKPPR